jgi:hypothetical protein
MQSSSASRLRDQVSYPYKTTGKREHRLSVFENKVVRIFGPTGEDAENYVVRSFIVCSFRKINVIRSMKRDQR